MLVDLVSFVLLFFGIPIVPALTLQDIRIKSGIRSAMATIAESEGNHATRILCRQMSQKYMIAVRLLEDGKVYNMSQILDDDI